MGNPVHSARRIRGDGHSSLRRDVQTNKVQKDDRVEDREFAENISQSASSAPKGNMKAQDAYDALLKGDLSSPMTADGFGEIEAG